MCKELNAWGHRRRRIVDGRMGCRRRPCVRSERRRGHRGPAEPPAGRSPAPRPGGSLCAPSVRRLSGQNRLPGSGRVHSRPHACPGSLAAAHHVGAGIATTCIRLGTEPAPPPEGHGADAAPSRNQAREGLLAPTLRHPARPAPQLTPHPVRPGPNGRTWRPCRPVGPWMSRSRPVSGALPGGSAAGRVRTGGLHRIFAEI